MESGCAPGWLLAAAPAREPPTIRQSPAIQTFAAPRISPDGRCVVYDGFGHGINKPRQARAAMEENDNWFGRCIFGDPLAGDMTPGPSDAGGKKGVRITPLAVLVED